MNGYDRIQTVLRGEVPDHVPVMLHNFMLAARESGVTMAQFRSDAATMARCFIESAEKYDLDGVMIDVDTATLAGALGVPVDLPEDQPALARGTALRSLAEVDGLPPVNVAAYPRAQVWLEAVERICGHFGKEVFIRGNCDQCAFSLATMMRTPEEWMMGLADPGNRDNAHRLLRHCAAATDQFLQLMARTGAHMVSNGDSPAGPEMISPRMYREFAYPYERRAVEYAHALSLPYALHICGDTSLILGDMVATGSDALELDYRTDMGKACEVMRGRCVFIGNLDPSGVLALGSETLVREKTRQLLDCFQNNPRLILNAGCAIPPTTPSANIRAMVRAVRS